MKLLDQNRAECDECGRQFRIKSELLGSKVRCRCGNVSQMPAGMNTPSAVPLDDEVTEDGTVSSRRNTTKRDEVYGCTTAWILFSVPVLALSWWFAVPWWGWVIAGTPVGLLALLLLTVYMGPARSERPDPTATTSAPIDEEPRSPSVAPKSTALNRAVWRVFDQIARQLLTKIKPHFSSCGVELADASRFEVAMYLLHVMSRNLSDRSVDYELIMTITEYCEIRLRPDGPNGEELVSERASRYRMALDNWRTKQRIYEAANHDPAEVDQHVQRLDVSMRRMWNMIERTAEPLESLFAKYLYTIGVRDQPQPLGSLEGFKPHRHHDDFVKAISQEQAELLDRFLLYIDHLLPDDSSVDDNVTKQDVERRLRLAKEAAESLAESTVPTPPAPDTTEEIPGSQQLTRIEQFFLSVADGYYQALVQGQKGYDQRLATATLYEVRAYLVARMYSLAIQAEYPKEQCLRIVRYLLYISGSRAPGVHELPVINALAEERMGAYAAVAGRPGASVEDLIDVLINYIASSGADDCPVVYKGWAPPSSSFQRRSLQPGVALAESKAASVWLASLKYVFHGNEALEVIGLEDLEQRLRQGIDEASAKADALADEIQQFREQQDT